MIIANIKNNPFRFNPIHYPIMKKILCLISLLVWTAAAFSQESPFLKQMMEITQLEINDGEKTIAVFDMPEEAQHHYYLCVGSLGIGDDFIQLHLDPVSQLFLPLGDTLEEAQAKLEEFRSVAKEPEGTTLEATGSLALVNPTTAEPEPVYLTARRFIFTRNVEFSVKRDGYIRATYIAYNELGAMVNGVKFYRRIHPNEP